MTGSSGSSLASGRRSERALAARLNGRPWHHPITPLRFGKVKRPIRKIEPVINIVQTIKKVAVADADGNADFDVVVELDAARLQR